jgi:CheY-like chemotaxis protein
MDKQAPIILLAEDDIDDREIIAYAFAQVEGSYQLHIVNNGREALQFLLTLSDHNLPCLIVLDYNMPELTGAQVVQQLSSDHRFSQIPKVILSTSDNPRYAQESIQKGADAYRVKPDSFDQLVCIAREMVGLCANAAA